MRRRICEAMFVAGVVLAAAPAVAADVSVSGAWFRALPGNLPAGGYFTLRSNGARVTLTGAQSPACGMLMLHKSMQSGGMDSMMDVEKVDVAGGGTISFSPGGYHLMCTKPGAAMRPGNHVPVTLLFGDGTSTTVDFAVRNAAGR